MATLKSRKELEAEQAYYDQKDDMFFWTPDGVGGFWYTTEEEMWDQHPYGDIIDVEEVPEF